MYSLKKVAAFAVALALAVLPAQSATANQTPGVIEISHDHGGSIVQYAQQMTRARQQGRQIAFGGQCASACTMYLSLPSSQTCIRPGATFGFHLAHGSNAGFNQWGTDFMVNRYPGWVRAWINAHGGLTNRVIWMDYAYASRFIRSCASA